MVRDLKFLIVLFVILVFTKNSLATKEYPVPYPPLTPGIFPCMNCHSDLPRNKTKRVLKDMHQDIKIENHGDRWCYDCHDERNMDRLKLANGDQIKFEDSFMLCGQCHGNVLNDWKKGIHGKRTGSWNGEKQYLLCVHCHNPHNPPFKAIKPEPVPIRPEATLLKPKHHNNEKKSH